MRNFLIGLLFVVILAGCGLRTEEGLLFRTADPNLSFVMLIPDAGNIPPLPTVEPEVLPTDEPTAEATPDLVPTVTPTVVEECDLVVKGNISNSGEAIYHVEGQANYGTVVIDASRSNGAGIHEAYFCTPEEAEAAGFRAALR